MEIVKNKQRYFLAVLLLLCSTLNIKAEVLTGSCGDNVTYTLDTESGLLEIKGTGPMADYLYSSPSPWDSKKSYIRSCVISEGVTTIGRFTFCFCYSLTSVTISNSVTTIGSEAFSMNSALTSVTIPNSVISIEESAFYGCSGLTSVTIPNSVTYLGRYAFYGCSGLTSMTIPNSMSFINEAAFQNCKGITSITIPNSVTYIGYSAFAGCTGLTSISVEAGNAIYDSRNNCNAIVETSSNTLVVGCQKTIIPNGVTTIGSCAFYKCSGLTSIAIPNSVTTIGSYAFYECSGLTSINIPASVNAIGSEAFVGCENLPIENNIRYAETYLVGVVDNKCASIKIKEGTRFIGDFAFKYCSNLTSVTIPNTVTSIGGSAFYGCYGLTSVTIPNSVTTIGNEAFANSALTSVTIPNSVTSIGISAFEGCSGLTTVTIPNSVTSIGRDAFYGCSGLTSVTIPNSVTSIGSSAFEGCSNLTSVTIPSTVESITSYAFSYCYALTSVTCRRKTPPSISSSSFSNYGTLHVLPGCKSAYEKASYWKNFTIVEDAEVLPLCAAPTIEYSNGKIACKSETVGATCYISYTIKSVSGKGTGNVAVENPQIEISAYAIAEGYDASDTVTKTFDYVSAGNGGSGDVNGDGKVTMADANAIVNMVLGK